MPADVPGAGSVDAARADLPLFPLQSVLFPGGLLGLKIFEARYVDLVSLCLREQRPFGVICLSQGAEAGRGPVALEPVGTLAQIDEVDSEAAGILRLRCTGGSRFALDAEPRQQADGLWTASTRPIDDDPAELPAPEMLATVSALAQAIGTLKAQGSLPFLEPYRLDDAGWVANRWCEILPIALAAKQKLMALESASLRLKIVDEYLRSKQVVSG
ncbi:MAG: LON peptidase substrate-binding domain-containing protein [Rubrivivax sp.]|jgi:Lon protease-like protein|nr:LON peptidase substrate-binding domain-containing protein [Rubrivivax sp.]